LSVALAMMCPMVSMAHEAPLRLLQHDPLLAAILLRGLGVAIPADTTARLAPSDLNSSVVTERRADSVVALLSPGGAQLAVIVEVQLRYDPAKRYSWPEYLTRVRSAHRCPAVLLVICLRTTTARRCRESISTGHPGFDLAPLVIDATTLPGPGTPGAQQAVPELTVLAVLTGALDLGQDSTRQLVLTTLADLDEVRLRNYTRFVLNAASDPARRELEALMTTTKFRDTFVDRLLAEGEAKGEAKIILRFLAARGFEVPAEIRRMVLACDDLRQLETWADRAATAATLDEVFAT
jgi:hypothetical protein